MNDLELEEWLRSQPLTKPVSVGGETVYLNVGDNGAELVCVFLPSFDKDQLEAALKTGFESALEFEAGWSIESEEGALLLSRWLPSVTDWVHAAHALENLLDQVGALRSMMTPTEPEAVKHELPKERWLPDEARMKSRLLTRMP
jgi:hypothetical protein